MTIGRDDYVSVQCLFKHATDKAILVAIDDEETWIPRALLSYSCDKLCDRLSRNSDLELRIPRWKADIEGYDYD